MRISRGEFLAGLGGLAVGVPIGAIGRGDQREATPAPAPAPAAVAPPSKAPAYVSIDAEGWHLAILKSIDYARLRPLAICVETLVSGTRAAIPEIPKYMASQGYVDRGGSFVNTIFVDGKRI